MSLEAVATNGRYAVVVSDGLAWNNEAVTDEWAKKQIRLGSDIAIAAGGKCVEVAELFQLCQNAFDAALDIPAHRAEAVRKAFESYVGSKPFVDFGKTILGGLLAIRKADGFEIVKQNGDYSKEVYQIEPGDEPRLFYLTPTGTIKALCFMFEREILEPMRNGASPSQVIANLHSLYHAAAQLEDPPKSNENLRIAILGGVPTGEPCEPDKRLASALESFVRQVQEAGARAALESENPVTAAKSDNTAKSDNAINVDGFAQTTALGISATTETDLVSVSFTANGGEVQVEGNALIENNGTTMLDCTLRIRQGSMTGTPIYAKEFSVAAGQTFDATIFGLDQSPGTSAQYYYLTLYASAACSTEYISLMAGDRKK